MQCSMRNANYGGATIVDREGVWPQLAGILFVEIG